MNLSNLVKDYKLFIDASSLMHENAAVFFSSLFPIMLEEKKKIFIGGNVLFELEQQKKNINDEIKRAAKRGLEIYYKLKANNLIDLRGDENNPHNRNEYGEVFSKFMGKFNLALLTQQYRLAKEIFALKNTTGIILHTKTLVLKLDKSGNLSNWKDYQAHNPLKNIPVNKPIPSESKFQISSRPRPKNDKILKTHNIPCEGETVEVEKFGRIRLVRILGEGGEGRIYQTDNNLACKIYFKERLTENRYAKLQLMTDKKINIPGVCWPLAVAKNNHQEFVGYLMPLAEGIPMQKSVFVRQLLENKFPHWTRSNLVQLAITWLVTTVKLHNLNVIIGDINPLNFLIKSDRELFFVDTDSYQIEDFPCPVGMVNFTAPEIQKLDFSSFLRKPENEYFAIATLLFMILLPGKPPYSHQGGGDPLANIRKAVFPYPFGQQSNRKTPEGPWRFIWSHLPHKTKEAFYYCFAQNRRIGPREWLELMKFYKYSLDKGHMDPEGESERIFPRRLKSISKYAKSTYDLDVKKSVDFRCDNCGILYSVSSERAKKIENHHNKLCPECLKVREIERTTGDIVFCSDCNEKFLISVDEKRYYIKKNLSQPKRCKTCRVKKSSNRVMTKAYKIKRIPNLKVSLTNFSSTNPFISILDDLLGKLFN